MTITTEIETCTGHRLLDYKGKCAHPHGHNYRWIAHVEATVADPKYGIAIDFSVVKRILAEEVEAFDHAMVLRQDDPLLPLLEDQENRLVVLNVNPTAENLASYIATRLSFALSTLVTIELWETAKCRVYSTGTHGGNITVLRSFS